MDKLTEICEKKASHVAYKESQRSINDLKYIVNDLRLPASFLEALQRQNTPALIAEVKKASPSKGIIREDFNPVHIAQIYKDAGATCLSVLTDEPYFQGHDDFLIAVKKKVDIPALRKDFTISQYQIYESRVLGANCILLIMAALTDQQAFEFYEIARSINLDVLVEVHNLEELERAKRFNPMMIGVNNRNLKTLEVDINTSFDLAIHMPKESYWISESGIGTHKTLSSLHDIGYRGFLVGESLMRQDDIAKAVKTLLNT